MGKTRVLPLLIIFMLFTLFGFGIALIVGRSPFTASAEDNTPTSGNFSGIAQQQSLILIHSDDLTAQSPRLVTVWIALITQIDDQPYVHFKQLYPSLDSSSAQTDLASTFQLGMNGKPVQDFYTQLKRYNIAWNGTVMVDDAGGSLLSGWLQQALPPNSDSSSVFSIRQAAAGDPSASLETAWLTQLCSYVSQRGLSSGSSPKWSEVMPKHMRTDLDFSTLQLTWEQLTSAPQPTRCKFIQ
jgi:hypothetical protein